MMARSTDDCFSSFHPVVLVCYFVVVIGLSMFVMHPVLLACSLLAAAAYRLCLAQGEGLGGMLGMMAAAMLLPALLNPLFNHGGITVLFWLAEGVPVTLEAVLYGLLTGFLLASVMTWFGCYQVVVTADKFMHLFGRIMPSLSMVFTMALSFIPRFRRQFARVDYAQECVGSGKVAAGVRPRVEHALKTTSIMTTWALEGSVQTADSMRSRGYGLGPRTSFSLFSFGARDAVALAVIAGLCMATIAGLATGALAFRFFPVIEAVDPTWLSLVSCAAFAALCFLPLIVDCLDEVPWRCLKSNI